MSDELIDSILYSLLITHYHSLRVTRMMQTKPSLLTREPRFSFTFALVLVLIAVSGFVEVGVAQGQSSSRRKPVRRPPLICGNPNLPCKTSVTFQPHDLPFRISETTVMDDTELFYAIILKSVRANEDDCNTFVPEPVRLEAQALFPDRKVFASRCVDAESLFYTNVDSQFRIMAVYAGTTLAEAKRVLATVTATGKYPSAYLRRMRTGFNGT
jgi:hypothetical protein